MNEKVQRKMQTSQEELKSANENAAAITIMNITISRTFEAELRGKSSNLHPDSNGTFNRACE